MVFDKKKTAYQIDFASMMEIPEVGDASCVPEESRIQVIRQDKLIGKLTMVIMILTCLAHKNERSKSKNTCSKNTGPVHHLSFDV
jgi:hypothetical protein